MFNENENGILSHIQRRGSILSWDSSHKIYQKHGWAHLADDVERNIVRFVGGDVCELNFGAQPWGICICCYWLVEERQAGGKR